METTRIEDRTLLAAQGYFELGMMDEALAEINQLPPEMQLRHEAMQVRLLIHLRAKRWQEALDLSESLYRRSPREAMGFIHAAFCLHELGRTAEAKALLLGGPSTLLNEATYHYNLGCYEAALGNIEEAQAHLRISFKLDKTFRDLARVDPDLKGLWNIL
jgi:tetratricopeptide (TPR) repeat protein